MRSGYKRAALALSGGALLSAALCVALATSPAAAQIGGAGNGVELRYAWQPNKVYMYDVTIKADLPDRTLNYNGTTMYRLKSAANGQYTLFQRGNVNENEMVKPEARAASGPPGARGARGLHGRMSSRIPHHFGPPATIGPPANHEVTFDERGRVIKLSGETQLPMLLGDLALLVVEPFPKEREQQWQVVRGLTVIERQKEETTPFPRHISRFAPEPPKQETLRPGAERMDYEIKSVSGSLVTIGRTTYLRTAQEAEGPKLSEQSSTGDFVFDTQRGVLTQADIKLENVISADNITVKIPAEYHFKLVDDVELARRAEALKAAAEKSKSDRAAAKEAAAQPLTDEEAREFVAKLKDPKQRRDAAAKLSKRTSVDAHREEIAAALGQAMKDPDRWTNRTVIEALGVWGTADNVPALVKVLSDSDDHFQCSSTIKTLGAMKDPRAAEAIAAKFFKFRGECRDALAKLGPAAEPSVIVLLDDREEGVRGEACRLLGEIGTAESRPKLEKLALKARGSDASAAREALEKINARTN